MHGDVGMDVWKEAGGYVCNVVVGIGEHPMRHSGGRWEPIGPRMERRCNNRVTPTAAEVADSARADRERLEERRQRVATLQADLDRAATPAEATAIGRSDSATRYDSPETVAFSERVQALDFGPCWKRLTQSSAMPASHRLVRVTVNLRRRRFQVNTRVEFVAAEDCDVPLWESSDPRLVGKERSGFYQFEGVPLHTSAKASARHQRVFVARDGEMVFGDVSGYQLYCSDPYGHDDKRPFEMSGQQVWYACPAEQSFKADSRGKHNALSYPHDTLGVDVRRTPRVIRLGAVPDDVLQLMLRFGLQNSAKWRSDVTSRP